MILTLDIGNAEINVCCVEDGACQCRFTLSSDKTRSADEYAALLTLLLSGHGVAAASVAGAILCSVVPRLTAPVAEAVRQCVGQRPLIVGPGVKSGLNIRMDDPTELGGDLVAAAVAAVETYPLPCIVVDMATATAVGVIDEGGCYVGGLICPGVSLGQSSLSSSASQLPDVSLDAPRCVIGKNTRDCMRSGIIHGAAAMLDGVIRRIETELGQSASIAVTGDVAQVVLPHCRRQDIVYDEDLLMRGLWSIYCKNRDKR